MSSYRTAINAAIKSQLLGKTVAGQQVFTRLERPLDPRSDLPAIVVYTMDARRGQQDYGNNAIVREVVVAIEAAISADAATALDAANSLAEQIEAAMEADQSLGNVVQDCKWQASHADTSSHGETVMGVCLLEYLVEIVTNERPDGFGDDPFTTPPTKVFVDVHPQAPNYHGHFSPNPDNACGPNGCEIPAWGGDRDQ